MSFATRGNGLKQGGEDSRRARCRDATLVAGIAALVFLANLGGPALWDDDEPRNAGCAQEMQSRGDWVVPTFNGRLRTDKPILIYWLMRLSYAAFGVSEYSARLPSALLSIGTALATWWLGRALFGARAGLWSGIIVATSFLFGLSARAATTDAALVFCTTMALAAYGSSLAAERLSLSKTFLVYGSMGLAVLAKGPVGIVLPAAIIGVTAWKRQAAAPADREGAAAGWRGRCLGWLRCEFQSLARATRSIRLFPGLLLALGIALPWYILVGFRTDWMWPIGFLAKHNYHRFFHVMEGHRGPFFYYIPTLIVGTIPWSVPAWKGLVDSWKAVRRDRQGATVELFLLAWVGVYFAFFSLSRTKLPSYVLPCFPALAVLGGRVVTDWLAAGLSPQVARTIFGGLCLMGAGGAVVVPIMALLYVPPAIGLVWVAAIPLVGGAAALNIARRNGGPRAFGVYTATAVVLLLCIHAVAMDQIASCQNSKPIVERLRSESDETPHLATLGPHRPSLIHYSQSRVLQLHIPEYAASFLRSWPDARLVTRGDLLPELQPHLPPGIEILDRRPMFLRHEQEVIVLGRPVARIARLSGR